VEKGYGIEENEKAVSAAVENAAINGNGNTSFIKGERIKPYRSWPGKVSKLNIYGREMGFVTVEEKLAKSLTAESVELIPYLPYLLQDLWELGSSPRDILKMITKHILVSKETKVLDLACGKGAVSVNLAKELGCMVKGIDIIPEFIDFAVQKAQEFGVGELCEFLVGDITELVKTEKDYDIVILGAVGDVLGNAEETINLLKKTIKKGGYIIIDEAYGNDESNPQYLTREQWLAI